MNNDEKMLENNTYYINIVHINRDSVKLFRNAAEKFDKEKVTLQYPHSYRQNPCRIAFGHGILAWLLNSHLDFIIKTFRPILL